MVNLSNVTTSALKRELERRGWDTVQQSSHRSGPSFFERLGDNVHHLLSFLNGESLCRLDAAMTNREDRGTTWLPRLAGGLENAELVLTGVEEEPRAWLCALKWMIARGVPMPKRLFCPSGCDASQFTACFEHSGSTANCVQEIYMASCSGPLTADEMMMLQCCAGLKKLSLGRSYKSQIWEELEAKNWSCFKTLEYIGMGGCHLSSPSTAEIWARKMSALAKIYIDYSIFASLEQFCKIKTLQDVALNCNSISDSAAYLADLAHLNTLPALQRLEFQGCNTIDAALGLIKAAPTLRALSLSECGGISVAGAALIVDRFRSLEELHFYQCDDVTDEIVAVFSRLPALLRLYFFATPDITDAGIAHLRGHTCLQELSLSECRVSSESLAVIGGFTQLRLLDLSSTNICQDQSALVHLRRLTSLTYLNLRYSDFTDAGLESICAPNLRTIVLGDDLGDDAEWRITEPVLARLVAASTKLEALEFSNWHHAEKLGLLPPAFQAVLDKRGIQHGDYSYYDIPIGDM